MKVAPKPLPPPLSPHLGLLQRFPGVLGVLVVVDRDDAVLAWREGGRKGGKEGGREGCEVGLLQRFPGVLGVLVVVDRDDAVLAWKGGREGGRNGEIVE